MLNDSRCGRTQDGLFHALVSELDGPFVKPWSHQLNLALVAPCVRRGRQGLRGTYPLGFSLALKVDNIGGVHSDERASREARKGRPRDRDTNAGREDGPSGRKGCARNKTAFSMRTDDDSVPGGVNHASISTIIVHLREHRSAEEAWAAFLPLDMLDENRREKCCLLLSSTAAEILSGSVR